MRAIKSWTTSAGVLARSGVDEAFAMALAIKNRFIVALPQEMRQ